MLDVMRLSHSDMDSRLRGNDGVDYKVQRIFFSKKEFLHTLHPV
jgi:hypothetical protein